MYQANFDTKRKQESDVRDSSNWSASQYNRTASFVYSAAFTAPVLELLDAQPGERILDVGCGSGEVTLLLQKIVEQKGGVVVGTDFSESMVNLIPNYQKREVTPKLNIKFQLEKAKSNGVRYTFLADAQNLEIPKDIPEIQGQFDAAFSNAVLHWCKSDPLGVLTSVKKVLKPGGRFAAEMGGFLNCIGEDLPRSEKIASGELITGIRSTLHDVLKSKGHNPEDCDPWYFPSVESYANVNYFVFQAFDIINTDMNYPVVDYRWF